jgi:UDP-N-acetylglucosamine transferase subunit ALG13
VIFATCGSSHLPFDRMMTALGGLNGSDLHVQHGPAAPPPAVRTDPFLSFAEVVERIQQADVVISHAGVGSILCALRAGHTPIVFPRLKRYSETVDDHQAELARALVRRGAVLVAWSPDELIEAVERVPPRGGVARMDSGRLHTAVRAAINGEPLQLRGNGHQLPSAGACAEH